MVPEVILTALFLGLIFKGKLTRLADARIKYAGLIFVPLVFHIIVMIVNKAGIVSAHSLLYSSTHVLGFIALLVLVLVNSRIPGAKLMGVGIAANIIALVANHGMMPASKEAIIAVMGKHELEKAISSGLLRHAIIDGSTKLGFLCDIYGFERPFALISPAVYSIGDIITTIGLAVALVAIMCVPHITQVKVASQG